MKNIEKLKYLRFEGSLPFCLVIILGIILSNKKILDLVLSPVYSLKLVLLAASFLFLSIALFFAINDYFDAKLDSIKKGKRNPLVDGVMSKKEVTALFVVTCIAGIVFAYLVDICVFILALLTILSIYLYSAEPFRFKGRFLLDWITHSLPGAFLLMAGYLTVTEFKPEILWYTIPVFLLYVLVCNIQQIKDFETDKKFGLKTTVATLGIEKSITASKIILLSIYILGVVMAVIVSPTVLIIALLSLPVALFLFKLKRKDVDTLEKDLTKNLSVFYIGGAIVIIGLIAFRII